MTVFADGVYTGGSNSVSRSAGPYDPAPCPLIGTLWFRTGGNQIASLGTDGFDPTSATQIYLGTLPAGAIPINVRTLGGATGGVSPTINVGTLASATGFANGIRADIAASSLAGSTSGTLITTPARLATPTDVYGEVGSSAATGGTVLGFIEFLIPDPLRA